MQLIKVRLHGYKRFAEESTMNVDGKVVAIVGPNEAGKSSFLQALGHLNHDQAFNLQEGSRELSRGADTTDKQKVVWGLFRLDDTDREAVSDLGSNFDIKVIEVWKTKGGERTCQLPEPLARDKEIRHNLKIALETTDARHVNGLNQAQKDQLAQRIESLLSIVSQGDKNFENLETELKEAKAISGQIRAKGKDELEAVLSTYIDNETEIKKLEAEIQKRLLERVPEILLFDEQSRELKSNYDASKIMASGKAALNLINLAGVDPKVLEQNVKSGYTSEIETWQEQGNARLAEIFKTIWSQSGITVRFRVSANVLHIIVGNRDGGYSTVAERSDGLKFYIALAAFVGVDREIKPILLVDEAETHLHYDAQADLIQMFYEQEVAAKIIYSTHSAGCLPEDLGTSIRIVKPEGEYKSSIQNQLWKDNAKGFRPLLLAMGAGTLAFNSVRYGLFVEGLTDCLLLPTLFKEVMEIDHLGFQILPGLSRISKGTSLELELEAKRMAYLVDGDGTLKNGGGAIMEQLKSDGIAEERIFSLPKDITLEDLVSRDIYSKAEGESINKSQKEEVVYRILERKYEGENIVKECHRETLKKLYQDIIDVLGVPKTNS